MTLKGERHDKPTYAILRSIGGGGTGDVYEADHKVFGCRCVQKTYSTLGMEDAMAHLEPKLLHSIDHPHVVKVLEAQYDPDISKAITFVSVYYDGGCIAKALDQGYRFSIIQSLRLMRQLLSALTHVHTAPQHLVIHRDVKPGNAFMDAERRNLYLGDWGSAAVMDATGLVGSIEAGTPLYTPPEGGPLDGRLGVTADIYSAGLTLFEMLNGPLDYASIDPSVVDRRLSRGQRAVPESTFVFAPHVPGWLRSVVRKAIRTKPEERYQSASAFSAALSKRPSIDWTHEEGEGYGGRWTGTWPPNVGEDRRRRYRVESTVLKGGPHRGQRRLVASQALSATASFSRFGVDDETCSPDDGASIDRFFAAIEDKAAQLAPAR